MEIKPCRKGKGQWILLHKSCRVRNCIISMDAEHTAHLQRILENRRKRGAYTSPIPPQPQSEPRGYSAASVEAAPPPAASTGPQLLARSTPPPSPPASSAAPLLSALRQPLAVTSTVPLSRTAEPLIIRGQEHAASATSAAESELRLLVEQNRRLQQNQLLQEKRIEALQNELRGGFSGINQTIRAALTPLRAEEQQRSDPREKPRSLGAAHAAHLLERDAAALASGRQYPIPARLADGAGLPAVVGGEQPHSAPVLVPFRATTNALQSARPGATELPRKPPVAARPFTTSTIDIDSSITILRSGNWWLKWNRKGTEVNPRYVWLDTEKYVLSWGKQRGAPTLLSGHINVEHIHGVTTSQTVEYEDDVARVFFILVIHTSTRQVHLATEKREKLDSWFDALNNIATFYHSHGVLMREEAPSTE